MALRQPAGGNQSRITVDIGFDVVEPVDGVLIAVAVARARVVIEAQVIVGVAFVISNVLVALPVTWALGPIAAGLLFAAGGSLGVVAVIMASGSLLGAAAMAGFSDRAPRA